jgi:uncharacterized LabA/DUF88 family protein
MQRPRSLTKVGVFVDVANVTRNGGYGMRFDMLREFACRDDAEPVRLNAYVAYDEDRARSDVEYQRRTIDFHFKIRDFGYKVIEKKIRWYTDDAGNRYGKADADLEMAMDALLQSENLDRVVLVSGDGDFLPVVRTLQNKGCRVEVVGFNNVSSELRREADMFVSGYLVPNLIPIPANEEKGLRWGETGSRVRGICYYYNHLKKWGFVRFLDRISRGLWITDTRRDDSPYRTAFVHETLLPEEIHPGQLPHREYIFEIELEESDRGLQVRDIHGIYRS